MKQKLGPPQLKWVKALESGRYRQITGYLQHHGGNCCLGVACRVLRIKKTFRYSGVAEFGEDKRNGDLPAEVVNKLGFYTDTAALVGRKFKNETSLQRANDYGEPDPATFKEIAAFVRKYPEAVFYKAA